MNRMNCSGVSLIQRQPQAAAVLTGSNEYPDIYGVVRFYTMKMVRSYTPMLKDFLMQATGAVRRYLAFTYMRASHAQVMTKISLLMQELI